ncbi:hypothetical protein DP125_13590 [Clostridium tetani]|uniref:Uncharacterized protein n=1 Tax=Clostridium tetani TaxID=1513 RepID=A0ABY0EQU0_CLOTA|nr:hypothetical protein [Clostridium tetani]YP_009218060.1 hypothetical protein phiCT19406C_31 [Clostridium phage phiCT19406C]AJA42854.1 hypothetical protein phiCT19406C_31 [Clostridium phage phiCT19406C]KGI44653.1 hypothetical protein KY54_07190 [Clostridium tetani]KHO30847.1 hypothetical protein OR63_13365 [Clostridium tetani]RXI57425.1 hypothetical protein DP131_05335 [Clostridium tetani]RXI57485.1 hypothetical protein DP125_13590 [Clostridium tetani]
MNQFQIKELMELYQELDNKQKEIGTRLAKGMENYTEEDVYMSMSDDEEVKKLLKRLENIKNKLNG